MFRYCEGANTLTIEEIRSAVENDKQLRAVRAAIKTNLWSSDLVKPFRTISEEITIDHTNHILLRGTRIIIPQALQSRVIKIAHEGHQGVAKTKAMLREYVWFPEIEKLVKEEIDTCIACQATGPRTTKSTGATPTNTAARGTMERIESRLLRSIASRPISFGCYRYIFAISGS